MALFAIADLHLSFSCDKSMDVFRGWENYTERIRANWNRLVSAEDTVVIAGDISWAIGLEGAKPDFDFIHSLNGKKIILKGNHDYWWSTAAKMNNFLKENNFDDISILHNNCFVKNNIAVCGTRGWLYDSNGEKDEKVIRRECGRLEQSLNTAVDADEKIVFLHYPPVYAEYVCEEIFEVIKRHGIKEVYYGHIHGSGKYRAYDEYDGVKMYMISSDSIDFTPVLVRENW